MNKIWLADDDEDDRLLFEIALKEIDPTSTLMTFPNGVILLQQLVKMENNLPTVLFLDLNMPLKNGFDCLFEIQQRLSLQKLPIIILSTSTKSEVIEELYHQGAYAYIAKPGTQEALRQAISTAFELIAVYVNLRPPKDRYLIIG